MTPYLQAIWNRLVRCYRLKNAENGDVRVLRRETQMSRTGGKKRCTVTIRRHVLCYYKKLGYIDFQEQAVVRRFRDGRCTGEDVQKIPQHFTVNNSGSIRRLYRHEGAPITAVRSISMRNYYLIEDAQVACLIMANIPELEWLRDVPVAYYPVTNNQLHAITSLDAFYTYFTGPNIEIPKRLRHALPVDELLILLQLVPGSYLNAVAATLKNDRSFDRGPATACRILITYYRKALKDSGVLQHQTVYSYLGCCRALGKKMNPRIRSMKRLEEERDALRHKRTIDRTPPIHTRKRLILGETDFGDVQLELIDSKARLQEETAMMQSCVDTYGKLVADGLSALYHVRYRGRDYTLEVREDERGCLVANQLLGVRNARAPKGLVDSVSGILKKHGRAHY